MANDKKFVVKNGLQAQNISFVDSDKSNTITARMLANDALAFSGNAGQLFSISDSLAGTIFAVNDVSGVPSIEVDDDGEIRLAETFGHVLIGTDSSTDTSKHIVQIKGGLNADSVTIDTSLKVVTDVDNGWTLKKWGGGAFNTISTVGMGSSEYVLLSGGDHTYLSSGSGSTTYVRGGGNTSTHELQISSSAATFAGDLTISGGNVFTDTSSQRVKYHTYSNSTSYGMGMLSGTTFGGLNDWALTFQFNDEADRGFWFGDAAHSAAQGAMALTTDGKLTVAHSARIGYGEADTTTPGATHALDISGSVIADSVYVNAKSIVFEGATGDAHETTIAVTEPTADRTITFPDTTGDVPVKLYTDITTSGNSAINLTISNSVPNASTSAQTHLRWVVHDIAFSSGPNNPILTVATSGASVTWTGAYYNSTLGTKASFSSNDLFTGFGSNYSPRSFTLDMYQTDTNDWLVNLISDDYNGVYFLQAHATGFVPYSITISSGSSYNVTGLTGSLTEEFGVIS